MGKRGGGLFPQELFRFILVGCLNTLLGIITMFGFYDWLAMGYWGASALSYFLCSILSFYLNKNFTFRHRQGGLGTVLRFALNIGLCYLLAYGVAKPLVLAALTGLDWQLTAKGADQVAMLTGMVLFTALNFWGQKRLVFNGGRRSGRGQ